MSTCDDNISNLAEKSRLYTRIANKNDSAYWDALAHPVKSHPRFSHYAQDFIRLAGIRQGETVLDMGCGSGTICIPLIDRGHKVFCGDFSPKMLQTLEDIREEEHLEGMTLAQLAWEDDWDALGVPRCDVAIASRSIFDPHIELAVQKLDAFAKRRVCLSINASTSMFKQAELETFLRREVNPSKNLQRVVAAGFALGRQVEVTYLRSTRIDVYQKREDVAAHLRAKIGTLDAQEEMLFEQFCELKIVEHFDDAGKSDGWYCNADISCAWAFVGWDKVIDWEAGYKEVHRWNEKS